MGIIKNQTPYNSKPFLKFERHPHYTRGGRNGHVLNKVHLNLGFTKFVSRVRKAEPRPECIQLINRYTNGQLKSHPVDGGEGKTEYLKYSFVSKNNVYIGDVQKAWWFYKQNLMVFDKYPSQVAIVLNRPAKEYSNLEFHKSGKPVFEGDIKGYYGFTHRGGQTFTIGDRLFDEKYEPKKEDYPEWQWAKWQKEYDDALEKYKDDEWELNDIKNDGVSRYIPFRERGKYEIKTQDEAIKAALRISNYLS